MAAGVKQPCVLPLQTYCRLWSQLAAARLLCSTSSNIPVSTSLTSEEAPISTSNSPTGWAPPTGKPAPPGVKPDIPFRVRRSVHQQFPVYSDYRNGRTRVLTKISKIDGDIVRMEQMLREYLQVDNLRSRVDIVTNSVTLSGDHRVAVRRWLKDLGF